MSVYSNLVSFLTILYFVTLGFGKVDDKFDLVYNSPMIRDYMEGKSS